MKAVKTWIVVADGARARILLNEGPGKGIHQLSAMDAESHAASRELGSDRPGRVNESMGSTRHAIQPRSDWHVAGEQKFAIKIAQHLDARAAEDGFDRLVLVADPKTLGVLRDHLTKQCTALVTGEIAKDLTHVAIKDLASHLGDVLVV
jgi:protein required for attachment to host cells